MGMKFTIDRRLLIKMIEKTRRGTRYTPNRSRDIYLSACAARVFIIGPVVVMGYEAMVLEDGECRVPAKRFLDILRSYQEKENITIQATAGTLTIARFTMPITGYTASPNPPADFQVFPVTDLRVLGDG